MTSYLASTLLIQSLFISNLSGETSVWNLVLNTLVLNTLVLNTLVLNTLVLDARVCPGWFF